MSETDQMTREQWLLRMVDKLRPNFVAAGAEIPRNVRVSCGWTSERALSAKSRRIGECWSPECSADKAHEIFISPCLGDVAIVGSTLLHEVVHAAVGVACGHKGEFRRVAVALGLEGKMTATIAGAELAEQLKILAAEIGPYPHASLDRSLRPKQGTRMLKVVCPDCGYTVRTTRQWIEQGLPTCCCGGEMEVPGESAEEGLEEESWLEMERRTR